MRSKRTTRWLQSIFPALAVCALAGAMLAGRPAHAQALIQPSIRTLSGTVTDGHEPIHGAIVELRDQKSNLMVSYLTDANGHYSFKRLDGNADYDLHVIYRGHHSATRSISKFDSHMNKVINFTMRTY